MGPDARCAVGVHCEKWWLSGGPHPQRRLYLLVGDPAPFGLSCGGRCSGRLEEAGRVEVIGAPHCEHSVRAGATVVLGALSLAGAHTPFERPVSGRTRWTSSCKL